MKKLQAVAAAFLAAASVGQVSADPGYFASAELLLLAPKVNSTGFEQVFYEGVDFTSVEVEGDFDDGLEAGYRIVAGKESCDGFGVQFRYFHFDQNIGYDGLWDAGAGTVSVIGDVGVQAMAFDAEVFQRGKFRSWDTVLSGGLRYGSVEYNQPANFFNGIPAVVFAGATGLEFDGVGPTLALTGERELGYGLSIVGRARVALLFGEIDYTPAFRSGGSFTIAR